MTNPAGTPRTNDALNIIGINEGLVTEIDQFIKFARQLESELAAAKARAGWLEEMASHNNRQYEKQLAETVQLRDELARARACIRDADDEIWNVEYPKRQDAWAKKHAAAISEAGEGK